MKLKILKSVVAGAKVHAKDAIITVGNEIKQDLVKALVDGGYAEEHGENAPQQRRTKPETKADFLKEFAGGTQEFLGNLKKDVEQKLKEKPGDAIATAALEAINELLAAPKK